jgi:hypothetical protein
VYFRRVDSDDLNRLASDGDGKEFLIAQLHPDCADVDYDVIDAVWEERLQGLMRYYLWQCR